MQRKFEGIWIPKEIWLTKELTIQEKLFYVEICSLDNDKGCFAGNQYFSEFFDISKTRVSLVIKSLVDKGFIKSTIIYKEGTQQILKRVLNKSYIPPFNKSYIPPLTKVKDPIQQKLKDNNTINNTINNTTNNTPDAKASELLNSISKLESSPQEEERKKVPLKKESFDWDKLIEFIIKNARRKFKDINKAIQSKYKARLKDGYTKDDISNSIINATKSDFHKENNGQYLTPEYFSRAETIDKFSETTNDSDKTVAPKMNT